MSSDDGVNLDPYLFFKGNAKEAIGYYKNIFGGNVDITEYPEDEGGSADGGEEMKGKVMHGLLSGGDVRLMFSDSTQASDKAAKIELSLTGEDSAKLTELFKKLSEGGSVRVPLEKAPWGDIFGMLTDKYNIAWMVNITARKES